MVVMMISMSTLMMMISILLQGSNHRGRKRKGGPICKEPALQCCCCCCWISCSLLAAGLQQYVHHLVDMLICSLLADYKEESVEQYVGGGCVQIALLLPAGPEMTVASTCSSAVVVYYCSTGCALNLSVMISRHQRHFPFQSALPPPLVSYLHLLDRFSSLSAWQILSLSCLEEVFC